MLVFQYFDRYDNVHYILQHDYKDVVDMILGMNNLSDYQADKASKGFIKWFDKVPGGKVAKYQMINLKFNVFTTLEDYYVPKTSRYQMYNEYIISNVLLNYASHNYRNITIYNDNVWTVELQFSEGGNLTFWVAYELKDGTYRSSQVSVMQANRCLADFELKKAVNDKILSVYKSLAYNYLLGR